MLIELEGGDGNGLGALIDVLDGAAPGSVEGTDGKPSRAAEPL